MNNNSLFSDYTDSNVKLYDIQHKFYYAIDKIYYNDKHIPYDFKIGNILSSEGAYGKIYNSCLISKGSNINNSKNNLENCNYILKKLIYDEEEFDGDIDDFLNDFENEIYIQEKVAKYGLTSPVVLAYKIIDEEFCEVGFIMDKYEMTLKDFLNNPSISLEIKYKTLDIACHLLNKLHKECQIIHQDSHLRNFMFDSVSDLNSLKLIDFGMSSEDLTEKELILIDFKIFESSLFSDIKDKKLSGILRDYWRKISN